MSVSEYNQIHMDMTPSPAIINRETYNSNLNTNKRIVFEKSSSYYSSAIKIIRNSNENLLSKLNYNINKFKYVNLKYQENFVSEFKILLNIKSLAKQLKLSYFDVLSVSSNSDKLTELIDQRLTVLVCYEKLISNYKKSHPEFSLKESTLLKVVEQAVEKLVENDPVMIKADHEKFIAKTEENALSLLHLSQFLGNGSTGDVFELSDINTRQIYAYKTSRTGEKGGERQIRKEFEHLNLLNEHGRVYGVQSKPHAIHQITYKKDLNTSYIGDKYDGDLMSYIKEADNHSDAEVFENHLFIAHQLIAGLKYVQFKGMIHGDIKPGNVLIKKRPTGLLVCLADWEDAKLISQSRDYILKNRTYTPKYCPILKKKKKIISIQGKPQFIQMQYCKDLFALGTTLYQLFAKKSPFYVNEEGYPIREGYKPIDYLPNEINNLLEKMLAFDLKNSMTIDQIYETLDIYINHHHPELREKIELEMNNYPGTRYEIDQLNIAEDNRLKDIQRQFEDLQKNDMGFGSEEEARLYLNQTTVANDSFAVWPDPEKADVFYFMKKPIDDVQRLEVNKNESLMFLIQELLHK